MRSSSNKKSKKSKKLQERVNKRNRKFKQEVDTNVVSIGLKVLKEDADVNPGDPFECKGCRAILNKFSKLRDLTEEEVKLHEADDEDKLWKCEFCNHMNVLTIDDEEMPVKESVNYILENAKVEEKKNAGTEDNSIIFCLDLSGSMCVS